MAIEAPTFTPVSAHVQPKAKVLSRPVIKSAVDQAARRIAPLWPLQNFVAVNPYLGLLEQPFESAAHTIGRVSGARMTAPRTFYAEAIQSGRITDADLQAAISEEKPSTGITWDLASLKAFALKPAEAQFETLPTVAHVAQSVTRRHWATVVTEAISRWASSYFDQGQASWKSPWANLSPYAAWRAEAALDRTPEILGLRGFRQTVADLPEDALDTIEAALIALDIPADALDMYLHRLLATINGWASYARYHLWEAERYGYADHTLTDLLAIRLVWEVALLRAFQDTELQNAWFRKKHGLMTHEARSTAQTELAGDMLFQRALEKAYQRQLFARMGTRTLTKAPARAKMQAAFCIDVRSEIFRRALETVSNDIQTIGFAGFFGFPIEYVRVGDPHSSAQCPVLLTPQFVIEETVAGANKTDMAVIVEKRTIQQRVTKAWRLFKSGAVSCFGFVGPVGLAYLKHLIMDTLGYSRPVPQPASFGFDAETYSQLTPTLSPDMSSSRATGITPEQRLDTAERVLKGMSLTDHFARVVLLVGHGATTVNNPYATALDCGACGGHAGEANARVAAQVLNDPDVRAGLSTRGIVIPADTIFAAAQHDTTTDQVTLFDKAHIPASHAADIAQIEAHLSAAGHLARAERAALLNIDPAKADAGIVRRSRDWSQVRPEWGLAGCAAFIAAPRETTAAVDLNGRAFLHSYNWQQDTDFSVLELIMTAPMVVASWINLQYYASTVDNVFFGSGNKVLHNIVGTIGVLEGNGGDLRVGLPWQSVHNGQSYVHEPLRLTVMIQAPTEAISAIIAKHEAVRHLVDHGWLSLFALDNSGHVSHQYSGQMRWTPLS